MVQFFRSRREGPLIPEGMAAISRGSRRRDPRTGIELSQSTP